MFGWLIEAFFNLILTLVLTLLQIILLPINLAISALIPNVDFSAITNFFNAINQFIGWAVDLSMLYPATVVLLYAIYLIRPSTWVIQKIKWAWAWLQRIKFW